MHAVRESAGGVSATGSVSAGVAAVVAPYKDDRDIRDASTHDGRRAPETLAQINSIRSRRPMANSTAHETQRGYSSR